MALAVLVLNALLSFNNWWPTPAIRPDHRLAPEFVWLWVLVLVWTRAFGLLGNRLLALVPYTLLATGVPLLIVLTTTRSQGARERFTNGIDKLMRNRRQIASWICLLVGALVVVDTAITMATR